MELSKLKPAKGSTAVRKRLGKGTGSGWGKTAGKGHKGQRARKSGNVRASFEGGQTPLHRRIPKRGFTNLFAIEWSVVNLEDLERRFEAGATVDVDTLADHGLIWSRCVRPGEGQEQVRETRPVKILARGAISKNLTVKAHKFSQAAEEAIKAAGGAVEVLLAQTEG